MIFIGGAPAIGKSTIAKAVAAELGIQSVDFSEIMAKHLPKEPNPKQILRSTSPHKREKARLKVVRELERIRSPTLVTGHYGLATFDSRGVKSLEVTFPKELVEVTTALALLRRSKPLVSRDSDFSRFRISSAIEEAVFRHLELTTELPAIRLSLDRTSEATARLLAFVKKITGSVSRSR